jgi:hypothetical protein
MWRYQMKEEVRSSKSNRDRQYNDQEKRGQTIQWPREKGTDNTMTKRKGVRQYNDQEKRGQTMINTTLNRKLRSYQHEPYKKTGMKTGGLEG